MPHWISQLRSEMWKIFRIFLFSLSLLHAGQELEVRLATKVPLKPIYVSELHTTPDQVDWRYPEELRNALVFDLSHNGYSSVVPPQIEREDALQWPDPRNHFDLSFWKRQQIPFVLAIEATQKTISVLLFSVDRETSKRYPEITLTGQPELDRRRIHRLSDTIQKDLFGIEGIASHRILFSQRVKNTAADGPDWLSDIWISDWDGANAKRLTLANGYCLSPGFCGKGDYYYVSSEKGQSKIWRASLNNSKREIWIKLRGNQMLPCLAKSGFQLAFISDIAGRADLFVINLDKHGNESGRPRQLFSAPSATQASPTYSPDGRKVVFVSDKDGTPRLFSLEIQGPRETKRTHPKLLSRKNRENTSPSWSPDGTKLAYSARTEGVRQIWIYDFATDQEWQLTSGPENKENPSWAPDSLHLIYNTETNDVSELFVINLEQQESIQITSGFGQKRFASWEPADKEILHPLDSL